jgi:hypothetical protein
MLSRVLPIMLAALFAASGPAGAVAGFIPRTVNLVPNCRFGRFSGR